MEYYVYLMKNNSAGIYTKLCVSAFIIYILCDIIKQYQITWSNCFYKTKTQTSFWSEFVMEHYVK